MSEENKQSKNWLKALLVIFYLFIFILLLYGSFGYLDPDFGWHMKTGEQIVKTGAVPDINYNNYTLKGTHWVDHEWLANVFVYVVYHKFGYLVLSLLFAILILATLVAQLWFTRKYFLRHDRGLILVLFLQLLGVYASLPHLGVRVQEITILFLFLLCLIIYFYNKGAVEGRSGLYLHGLGRFLKDIITETKASPKDFFKKIPKYLKDLRARNLWRPLPEKKNYRILFWLIPLFILWASAHGGFLIGLFILALFIAVKTVELLSSKKPSQFIDYGRVLTGKQIKVFAIFSVFALAATLATPYFFRLYNFLFQYRDGYFQIHLAEWQSQWYFPFVYPQLVYLELVLVFLTLVFISAFVLKGGYQRKIDLYNLALIVVFFVAASKARRHFPLLFIVSLPIIIEFLLDFFFYTPLREGKRGASPAVSVSSGAKEVRLVLKARELIRAMKKRKLFLTKLIIIGLSFILIIAGTLIALKINFTNQPEKTFRREYPYKAAAYLRSHAEWNKLNFLTDYGWGGYLIWQAPERQLFIDGRLPQYPLNGRTTLQEYHDFFDKDKMLAQLEKYKIKLIMLKSREEYPRVSWWDKLFFAVNEKEVQDAVKKSFVLLEYLKTSPDWHSVYRDDTAVIFLKDDSRNRPLMDKFNRPLDRKLLEKYENYNRNSNLQRKK